MALFDRTTGRAAPGLLPVPTTVYTAAPLPLPRVIHSSGDTLRRHSIEPRDGLPQGCYLAPPLFISAAAAPCVVLNVQVTLCCVILVSLWRNFAERQLTMSSCLFCTAEP